MTEAQPSPQTSLQFASELISARAARGMTQTQLAEASGVSRSAIKQYETGRSVPGAKEIRALCIALEVTPNRLIFGTDAPDLKDAKAVGTDGWPDPGGDAATVRRARLVMLSMFLTVEEIEALALLAHAIAIQRHGADKVRALSEMTESLATAFDVKPAP